MAKTATKNVDDVVLYDQFVQKMELEHSVSVDDTADVQKRIVEKILTADDADTLFGDDGDLFTAESLLNEPLTVERFHYLKSDYQDGLGFYAICEATRDNGEALVFSIGAMKAMAQLFKAEQLGALPRRLVIIQKTTRSGRDILSFMDADKITDPTDKDK